MHAMSNGKAGQSATDATVEIAQFVDSMMAAAGANLGPNGTETSLSLAFEGYGIHTVEDSTSPMHTYNTGQPIPWNGLGFLGISGLTHWLGENTPANDWASIGDAVRLTMAFHLVLGAACEQGKTCLTEANFESEVQKNITALVQAYFNSTFFNSNPRTTGSGAFEEDAARQCALGNPAACD